MKLNFKEHKDQLFEILLSNYYSEDLLNLIEQLSLQGHTKSEIYELFLDFHKEIQLDLRTKNNEEAYNRLSDFMDGFTAWGKKFKILPNEPDL